MGCAQIKKEDKLIEQEQKPKSKKKIFKKEPKKIKKK